MDNTLVKGLKSFAYSNRVKFIVEEFIVEEISTIIFCIRNLE